MITFPIKKQKRIFNALLLMEQARATIKQENKATAVAAKTKKKTKK